MSWPAEEDAPAVEPERFRPPGEAFAGHWNGYPGDWGSLPAETLEGRARSHVRAALERHLDD